MMKAKIIISPQYSHLAPLIDAIAADGVPVGATETYHARNTVYSLDTDAGIRLSIKDFHTPSIINSLVYTHLRRSKARRSYENARRLISMGFDTPDPVAYIEIHNGPLLTRSYYICRQIDEAEDLRLWHLRDAASMSPILDGLARYMVRLHRAGVYHKDFSPGNILYRNENGVYRFYLIDINRMSFGVHSRKRLMDNFSRIDIESAEATADLARRYALAAGINPEATAAQALARLQGYLRGKRRHHMLKRLFKPSK